MPLVYNDGIDDPLLFDAQSSFLGGMVSNTRVNLLTPDQAALLQDVEVEQNGRLRTRRGFRDHGSLATVSGSGTPQGLHWFDSAQSQCLVAMVGGSIYSMDSTGAWQPVHSGAVGSAGEAAYMAQVNDRLFAVSGDTKRPTHWGGSDLTGLGFGAAIAVAVAGGLVTSATISHSGSGMASVPSVSLSGGGGSGAVLSVNAGVEAVEVSVGGTGYTVGDTLTLAGDSGTPATFTVTGVAAGVVTGVSVTSAGSVTATGGATNRTVSGGSGTGCKLDITYQLATVTVVAGGAGYTSPPGVRVDPAGLTVVDGPDALAFLTAQHFRLFGVNPRAIDELWVSEWLPGGYKPFTQEGVPISPIRIGEGEGDPITGLFAWKGFLLLVFKEASIWSVDTSPGTDTSPATVASSFTIQRVSGRVGCAAHRSIAMAGNDVYWLARDGVRTLQRTLADPAGSVGEALSYPVDDYIQRINWGAAPGACATYWNGRYLLAVPLDNSQVNNCILVYQPSQNRWQVWTGLQPVQFAVTRFDGQPQKLVLLDARGGALVFQDYIPQGQASAVHYRDSIAGAEMRPTWRIQTRAMVWQEVANPKQPDFVEFEFDRSTALADIRIGLDSPPDTLIESKVITGNAAVLVLPFTLPAKLGQLSVRRQRFSLLGLAAAREVMFELSEAANLGSAESASSGYVSLRSVLAGAYLETLEDQE